MSLYALVHGQEAEGPALLALLQERQPFNVGRYRDGWVEREGDSLLIRIHTRNGGGNREDYDDGTMSNHPWYLKDADDDFDETYADWWFCPPLSELQPETIEALQSLAKPPVDVGARWKEAINALETKE